MTNGLTEDQINDLITQSDAGRIRDCSRQAIQNLVNKGRLKVTNIAGIDFVSKNEILNFKTIKPGRKPKNAK